MNKLKQLNEDRGDLLKKLNGFTNERASKLDDLRALSGKETLTDEEEATYTNLKTEISNLDKKISRKEDEVAMINDQIENEKKHGDNPLNGAQAGNPGFIGGGTQGLSNSDQKDISKFSYAKMFAESLEGGPENLTGIEKEMHEEAKNDANNKGIELAGNVHVPTVVLENSRQIRNDITVTGGSSGSEGGVTVQTDVMSIIDILRARLPFVDSSRNSRDGLGATFFTDASGNMSFPRAIEGADPAEKTEIAASDEVSPTFEDLQLTPRRLPGYVEVSRQTLLQSSVDMENWIRGHLAYKVGKPMHKNIIQDILDASGTNPQEHGANGGAEDWASIVKYETDVLDSDAAMEDDPRLGWLTNSKVRGQLKTTEVAAGTAQFIYDRFDKTVNEYPMLVSSLVPSDLTKGTSSGTLSANIFANWASLYIAMWGGMSFLVNPYSRDTEGIVRINAWTFFDSGLRHASAFSVGKDIDPNA